VSLFTGKILRIIDFTFLLKISALVMILVTLSLVIRNPLVFPITDDVGYIPWGTRTVTPSQIFDFTLVAGHQQVLTKLTVWLIGILPGNYISYISYVNYIFYLLGCYFLIRSSFEKQKSRTLVFFICVILVLNMKQLYMFFMITALGPIQAFFCISLYYSMLRSNLKRHFYLRAFLVFITPSTTGLGLVLPLSIITRNIFICLVKRRIKFSDLIETIISITSMVVFYGIPSYLDLVVGSAKRPSSTLENLFTLAANPHWTILMIFALVGNVFFASNRFDPLIPSVIGFLFIAISSSLAQLKQPRAKFLIFQKHLTFLPGVFFIINILIYRGGGTYNGWENSVSPRYILGTLFLIISIISVLELKVLRSKFIAASLVLFSLLSMLGGLKTGLEWFSVRSLQQENLTECIDKYEVIELTVDKECFKEAFIFTDTNDENDFVRRFNIYLEYRGAYD